MSKCFSELKNFSELKEEIRNKTEAIRSRIHVAAERLNITSVPGEENPGHLNRATNTDIHSNLQSVVATAVGLNGPLVRGCAS